MRPPNNKSSIENTQCHCGHPAQVRIVIDEHPIVSNHLPYGQDVCTSCHFKHRQFKSKEIIEWLDYFKPRMSLFPFEYNLPPNAIIRNGRGIPFEEM